MEKKLCISLIFSNCVVSKHKVIIFHAMHNLYANFVKILEICKNFSINLVNELGNIPRPGVVPRFSDLEVVALSLTAEHLSIDSENNLFDRLKAVSYTHLLSANPYHQRLQGCRWQRLHEASHSGQLQPNQGRCQADCQGRAGAHRW